MQINPVQVLNRLQRLRSELVDVEREHSEVVHEKQVLAQACRETLLPCFEQLCQLATASGFPEDIDAGRATGLRSQIQGL
jgi:hypothetical protein